MEAVLGGLACDKCFVYLDDILVVGKTSEEDLDNMREVLIGFNNLVEAEAQ